MVWLRLKPLIYVIYMMEITSELSNLVGMEFKHIVSYLIFKIWSLVFQREKTKSLIEYNHTNLKEKGRREGDNWFWDYWAKSWSWK